MLSSVLSPSNQAPQPQRFVIAAGTARYEHLLPSEQLPGVKEDVRQVATLFHDLGYERVLPELGENPTSEQLRKALSVWMRSPARSEEDVVVFYYAGHGEVGVRKHHLLTSDSQATNLVGTTFSAEEIADIFVESKVRQALIILDTCYAGKGSGDFSTVMANMQQPFSDVVGSGFYTVSAASAREAALERKFVQALEATIRNPDRNYSGERQPYLAIDYVVGGVNAWFEKNQVPQTAFLHSAHVKEPPRLIPNLLYLQEDKFHRQDEKPTVGISRVIDEAGKSRKLKAFLSYSSVDKLAVQALFKQLMKNDVEVWLDEESLLPGQDWQLETEKAIYNADTVVICLSEGAINIRGSIQREIRLALDIAAEQPEGAIYLIPVRLENVMPP